MAEVIGAAWSNLIGHTELPTYGSACPISCWRRLSTGLNLVGRLLVAIEWLSDNGNRFVVGKARGFDWPSPDAEDYALVSDSDHDYTRYTRTRVSDIVQLRGRQQFYPLYSFGFTM